MSLSSLQDDMSRRASSMAAMANRSTNPQEIQAIQRSLVTGVQNGSIQPYVGIPLIQELTNKLTEAKAQMAQSMAGMQQSQQAPQGQQAPPIAEQVMQQAAQEGQGLEALPSNLPQEYAGGGIIAFENGGEVQPFQNQGLESLSSNLPQEYAGGGIMAFEDGGEVQHFEKGDLVDDRYKRTSSYYQQPQAESDLLKRSPLTIQDQVRQYKELMDAIPKGASQTEYEEYLRKRSGDAEATKKQDLNLALVQFGLNLAAGKSPRALENLGEAGIKTLPAVQEAYRQRRLADETSLRGRAELDRMSRAEQLEALKGGVGLYGTERGLQAEAEKAELQRQNAVKVAELQMAHKPTDLINYVNANVDFHLKDPKNTKSVEQLRVEAYNKYPGYVVRQDIANTQAGAQRAGQNVQENIAGGSQALTAQQLSQQAIDKATDNYSKALENRKDPITLESQRLKRLDDENRLKGNPTNLQLEHKNQTIRDDANSMTPSSQQRKVVPPPPAPKSTAPAGAAPSISSVTGAPSGSKIGAFTQKGWEVRSKDGTLIGYVGSN